MVHHNAYKFAKTDANTLSIEANIKPGIRFLIFRTWMFLSLWILYKFQDMIYNNLKDD